MGERTPVALLDAAASARMAVGEAITNIASAPVARLSDIKLSANWMAPAGHPGEDVRLYEAVRAIGTELCPALGIAIPVGKDSMSMRTVWKERGEDRSVTAPLSLIVTAFAPISDARAALTPQLQGAGGGTELLLIDVGGGKNRLGASCLSQVYSQLGADPADLDGADKLRGFFDAVAALRGAGTLLAYHDRSDGGLLVTLLEMAFAGGCGLSIDVPGRDVVAALFSEELGAVVEVRAADVEAVTAMFAHHGLTGAVHRIGRPVAGERVEFRHDGAIVYENARSTLRALWSETTHVLQALRDDAACAHQEQSARCDPSDPGRQVALTFDPAADVAAPFVAFAACGGFSYGDVLGAGEGWAKSILFPADARAQFARFFARPDTFALGVCNGCQMMSALKEIVPGAEPWPRFVRNRSEQFEARLCTVQIQKSPSVFFTGMAGARLPIAVAHGEGRAELGSPAEREALEASGLVAARYVDNRGQVTERYPDNPSGSPGGMTALTTPDGRVTIFMPHPERVFRSVQLSWKPPGWGEDSPWMRMFRNARAWVR